MRFRERTQGYEKRARASHKKRCMEGVERAMHYLMLYMGEGEGRVAGHGEEVSKGAGDTTVRLSRRRSVRGGAE